MMRLAVALDDQPSVDDEVHPSHAGDLHLDVDVTAEPAEDEADERLGPGLHAAIEESSEGAITMREAAENLGDVSFVDEAEVPRAVEGRDGIAGRLTLHRLGKCSDEIGSEAG